MLLREDIYIYVACGCSFHAHAVLVGKVVARGNNASVSIRTIEICLRRMTSPVAAGTPFPSESTLHPMGGMGTAYVPTAALGTYTYYVQFHY